jgi:hypothetical protein
MAARADLLLQVFQLADEIGRRLRIDILPDGLGNPMNGDRIAKVEECPAAHLRVVQDSVKYFQLGDTFAGVVLNPAEVFEGISRVVCRHPTIAFAEDADKELPAFVDLVQAEVKHLAVLGLLAGDAPAQEDAVLLQSLAEGREYDLDKVSRSACMSRKVEEMKTRTVFQADMGGLPLKKSSVTIAGGLLEDSPNGAMVQ